MLRNILFFIILCFAMGCSSTVQPSDLGKMQIRLAQLENTVQENSSRIENNAYDIKELSSSVEGLETYSDDDAVIEVDEGVPVSSSFKSDKTSSSKGIIRVPVSPKNVQTALKNAGYYNGSIDGKIGPGTKRAIESFQKDNDLVTDGIVGRKTWSEMKDYLE